MASKLYIVLSFSWRSGSTFLGELLSRYPGTFYSYEPLHFMSPYKTLNIVESVGMTRRAIQFLKYLFKCDYNNDLSREFLSYAAETNRSFLHNHNPRTWDICRYSKFIF
jgi:hypothetical protein